MKRLSLLISLGFSAGSRFLPRMGFFNRRGECRVQPLFFLLKNFETRATFNGIPFCECLQVRERPTGRRCETRLRLNDPVKAGRSFLDVR